MKNIINKDTIVAISTPHGVGAIAVIRLSGDKSFSVVEKIFVPTGKKLKKISEAPSHTIHLGKIVWNSSEVDEVLISVFKSPHSYTGEDVVEISCHGSIYIQQKILEICVQAGARIANPGEFTLRAFLNGKLSLSQAEAIGDLIASESESSHRIAISQLRGGFAYDLSKVRTRLLDFASLLELELDFAEEDVEFAKRDELLGFIDDTLDKISRLLDSFSLGNAIKKGIPLAIIGAPNVGKSTLMNALLNEQRAIVSPIAGTTRDSIEEVIHLQGIPFRLIDTAGIRGTADVVEKFGIEIAFKKIEEAEIVLYVFDAHELVTEKNYASLQLGVELQEKYPQKQILWVGNKIDTLSNYHEELRKHILPVEVRSIIWISAKEKMGVEELEHKITDRYVRTIKTSNQEILTNARHYEALLKTYQALEAVKQGLLHHIGTELLAVDLRTGLQYLGMITGEVTNDELLGNIFSRFCIGK